MISIELLAEYKERMKIAREMHDFENAKKYYELFVAGYQELTGKNLDDLLDETEKESAEEISKQEQQGQRNQYNLEEEREEPENDDERIR